MSVGVDEVIRNRKRPAPSTGKHKAQEIQRIFGTTFEKELSIPDFIDEYNHNMNGVDRADQLRGAYSTQRRSAKTWKPLWHFLLGTALGNSYLLASRPPPGEKPLYSDHQKFLEDLARSLFEHSERQTPDPKTTITLNRKQQVPPPLSEVVPSTASGSPHTHGKLADTARQCKACAAGGRTVKKKEARKPLSELSGNTLRGTAKDNLGRKDSYPRSRYGCIECSIHLCQGERCWQEHILVTSSS